VLFVVYSATVSDPMQRHHTEARHLDKPTCRYLYLFDPFSLLSTFNIMGRDNFYFSFHVP
jgi:hypothetical protein